MTISYMSTMHLIHMYPNCPFTLSTGSPILHPTFSRYPQHVLYPLHMLFSFC